jgi:preflagellin peptidase FlaK
MTADGGTLVCAGVDAGGVAPVDGGDSTERIGDRTDDEDGSYHEDDVHDDPWGAERFLAAIDHDAYGTDPQTLRAGLALVARQDTVRVSPGLPFLVPLTAGLLVAVSYGDVLFALLAVFGVG